MANIAATIMGRVLGRLGDLAGFLAGPILTKELRISSRRRRNFVLRGVYLAVLTVLVVLVWMSTVKWDARGTYAYRASRMFLAGRTIIVWIAWFQFIALQIIAVIMLSTAISEEIYAKTLGVLMTTPIRSFQIVVGKLFSKILQLLLLVAASLPMLAVLRVFGGVPWSYIVASVCLTLTTVVLVAAVTMFFSIIFRWAFVSILMSVGVVAVLYAGIPLIIALIISATEAYRHEELMATLATLLMHYNPFAMMTFTTIVLFEPRALTSSGLPFVHWWIPCLVSLGLSAVILTICVAMVRRVGLRMVAGATGAGPSAADAIAATTARQASTSTVPPVAGEPGEAAAANRDAYDRPVLEVLTPAGAEAPALSAPVARPARVRRIKGSPIIWRELRSKWVKRGVLYWVLMGVGSWLLLIIYALVGFMGYDAYGDDDTHFGFIITYTIIGALVTCVLAATNITTEKESRSWELLLCTPLDDWHIVLAKLIGTLRRCLPIWLLPIGHILLFTVFECSHVALLPAYLLVVVSIVAVLAGGGLYFGARFRRTTTAVILNLSLGLSLWVAVPGVLALVGEAMPHSVGRDEYRDAVEYVIDSNPFFQTGMLCNHMAGGENATKSLEELDLRWASFDWSDHHDTSFFHSAAYMMMFAAMNIALAAFLAWRAKCQFRKKWM